MKLVTRLLLIMLFTLGIASANVFDDLLRTGDSGSFTVSDGKLKHKNGEIVQYKINYTKWIPASPNGHVLIYNHGLQSHMGWYFPTAEELFSMDFTVYAFDRIASGKSSGGAYKANSGISNKKGHIRTWTLFTKTLGKMIDIVENENPKKKLHLWANSYGAKVVTAYMLEKEDKRIDSIVFTTPGLFRDKIKMPLPFNILKLLFSGKTKGFPTPIVAKNKNNGAHWFTSDEEWFDRIEKDELSGREFTKTFFFQTKKLDKYIAKKAKKKSLLREIPQIYLMVRNDPMMNNSKVNKHIKTLRNNKAYYKFYEGGEDKRHFLTFTSDRKEVLRDVKNFFLGEIDSIDNLK